MRQLFYEKIPVVHIPLESVENMISAPYQQMPQIMEVLDYISPLPLQDQTLMMCNILTVSGYTQNEIAQALGMLPQSYQNRLQLIRKKLK
jgi:hypothetical protein